MVYYFSRWLRNLHFPLFKDNEMMFRHLLTACLLVPLFAVMAFAAENPIQSIRYAPAQVTVLSGITAKPIISEELVDQLSISYLWRVNGEEVDFEDGPFLSGEYFSRGDAISIEVSVYSFEGEGYPPLAPEPVYVANAPPQIVQPPSAELTADRYRGRVYAEDADGDNLSYEVVEGPEGFEIDGKNGRFVWKPEEEQGIYPVKILVSDPYGGSVENLFELSVSKVQE
jgi:hypothetical protein